MSSTAATAIRMAHPPFPWMRAMWREAQEKKRTFIRAASDIEIAYLRRHGKDVRHRDIGFIWLDELLIGIEVRDGPDRKVYYDEDLRVPPQQARREQRTQQTRHAPRRRTTHKAAQEAKQSRKATT